LQGHHTHHAHDAHSHKQAGDHAHGHAHSHAPATYDRAFAIGITLNVSYAIAEAIAGWWLNSLALIADAGHNFSDVIGLLLAWFAVWLSRKQPSAKHSYGLGRSSILAALANAVLLLVAVGVIVWEAVHRIGAPHTFATTPVMAIATVGIAINGFTAWLFMRGSRGNQIDLNVRGAYLHMVADAAVSAGVVLTALVVSTTAWYWLDPVVSIAIAVVIAWGTWGLLANSLRLSLDGVPAHIDAKAIEAFFTTQPEVTELHDLHIWALSTEAVALTAHVVCPKGHPGDAWLARVSEELHERFAIDHATIQIETGAMECLHSHRGANDVAALTKAAS
jgi:cobalt-zinc-cadmium efflux system protein